ncbi:MAG: dihydropteroate synthase [Deltaproteobacteria bacterium]|nr:dihydropteroate synthase [Deltaproteobacteria bacterium]
MPKEPLDSPSRLMTWTCADGTVRELIFDRPLIMGIINITPDSFSDGGRFFEPAAALAQAKIHLEQGADILDLGAETTRPGSLPTPADEEWRRLSAVLETLARDPDCVPISVDTNKAEIAEKAILAGASIINDIYAGRNDPGILKVCASYGVPVILMHMQGDPRTMQQNPQYDDVVTEVRDFLLAKAREAMSLGIDPSKIILDPGLGFGKTAVHNLTLLKHLDRVFPRGFHSLMALSRKAFLGRILEGAPPEERDIATAAANAVAVLKGAEIIRVHNVKPSREAAFLARAVLNAT